MAFVIQVNVLLKLKVVLIGVILSIFNKMHMDTFV